MNFKRFLSFCVRVARIALLLALIFSCTAATETQGARTAHVRRAA